MANFDLETRTILLTLAGSRACGLAREDSDVDVAGIAIPPQANLYTLLPEWEQTEGSAVVDLFFDSIDELQFPDNRLAYEARGNGCEGTVYNLKKYISLALKANPTIWTCVFCRDSEVLKVTEAGLHLRANRNLFVSQNAKNSFIGYAISQLQRIKRHKKWLDNPPSKPSRKELGIPEGKAILNKEQVTAFNTMGPETLAKLGISQKLIEMIQTEKLYAYAMDQWKKYEGWRKNRNPARAALEANAGYDTKHAMHLMRLLHMGYEIIKDGEVSIWRDDRDYLLEIRDGMCSYEEILQIAEEHVQSIEEMAHASQLQKRPDFEKVDKLYRELLEIHYASCGEDG
jgi:uncharacterized protein